MQQAGWAADPTGRHHLRYHDGRNWTEHVSGGGTMGIDPMPPTGGPPPTPGESSTSVAPPPMAAPLVTTPPPPIIEPDKKPVWKRWWFITGVVFVIIAAIAAAVAPTDDEADEADEAADTVAAIESTSDAEDTAPETAASTPNGSDPETTTPAASEPSPTTAPTTAAPTTTAPMPEGGTADSPLPIGDSTRSLFEYESFLGDSWNGYVGGIVETGIGQFNDEPGRCLVVVGTLTATEVGAGTSNSFDAPSLTMLVDGRAVDSDVSSCDVDAIEAAGYAWILNAEVTQGTTYAFYDEFFLPTDAVPSALLVGDRFGDPLFFEPTVTTEIPEVGELSVGDLDRELLAIGDPTSGFTYSDFGDDEWEGYIGALIETPVGEYTDDPGRCIVVVGVLTPTEVDGVTANPFTAPNLSLIADGRVVQYDFNDCDTSALEAAGYEWILDAEVVEGTPYPFYDQFFLPDGTGDLDAVVVGSSADVDALYYEPTIFAEIPAPVVE